MFGERCSPKGESGNLNPKEGQGQIFVSRRWRQSLHEALTDIYAAKIPGEIPSKRRNK
jgi:hypothetical protein